MDINKRISEFNKRWNISTERTDAEKCYDFKTRTINSVIRCLDGLNGRGIEYDTKDDFDYFNLDYFKIIGLDIREYNKYNHNIYNVLDSERNFFNYIKFLEAISWTNSLVVDEISDLRNSFKDDLDNSCIDIEIKFAKDGYFFYPKGAKLLDNAVVNDVLDWLMSYEESYKHFQSALIKYQDKGKDYERNVIDDMRLSLELFIKQVLKNDKSLENQISLLGKYLTEMNISNEVKNMYTTLLKYYTDYQNHNIKHNEKINSDEIEFIIYLTGNFMRLILCLNN